MIKSLIKSSSFSTLTSIFAYGLTIVLARNESQLAFAELTYSIAWALIFTQIIDLASTQCLTHFKISSEERLDRIVANILVAKLATLGIVLLIIVGARFSDRLNIPSATVFFLVPAFYLGPVFELRSQNVLFAKILFAEKAVLLLFCFLYLKFLPIDRVVYIAYFVVGLASLATQFFASGIRLPRTGRPDSALLIRYGRMYWSIYLTLASQVAYGHVSRVVIEAKLGMLAFAAVSLALQIVNASKIVQLQVDRHLRPKVAEYVLASNKVAVRTLTINYILLYLIPLAAGCSVLYLFAEEIVSILFGSKWAVAGAYLRYLSPLIMTVAVLRYLDMYVVALEYGRANLVVNLFSAAVLISVLLLIRNDQDVSVYLLAIVAVQTMHVAMVALYFLYRYLRARAASIV